MSQSSKTSVRLTKAGYAAVGLTIPLYLASLTSQSSLLLTLIGILLGCLLVNFIAARQAIQSLRINIPARTRVEEGAKPLESWTLLNQASHAIAEASIRLNKVIWWRVFAIPPGAASHAPPSPPEPRRGIYPLKNFYFTTCHPFGLVRARQQLNLSAELIVHPALPVLNAPVSAGHDQMVGGKQKGTRRGLAGGQFAGIRPHQPGDPLKQVHWKSTAKGQGMMVKTYDEELSGRVSLLFDNRKSAAPPEEFETLVRHAGGLLFASLDAGDHFNWINLADGEKTMFTPFADAESTLDFLARLEQRSGGDFTGSLTSQMAASTARGTVVVVLGTQSLPSESDWLALDSTLPKPAIHAPKGTSLPGGKTSSSWTLFNPNGEPA